LPLLEAAGSANNWIEARERSLLRTLSGLRSVTRWAPCSTLATQRQAGPLLETKAAPRRAGGQVRSVGVPIGATPLTGKQHPSAKSGEGSRYAARTDCLFSIRSLTFAEHTRDSGKHGQADDDGSP